MRGLIGMCRPFIVEATGLKMFTEDLRQLTNAREANYILCYAMHNGKNVILQKVTCRRNDLSIQERVGQRHL